MGTKNYSPSEFTVESQISPQPIVKRTWILATLVVLLLLALISIIVMAIFLSRASHASEHDVLMTKNCSEIPTAVNYKDDICLTPPCVSAATRIRQGLDTSVDPCVDFYQFSCGNWMKTNDIEEDKVKYSSIDQLQKQLLLTIKKLAEEDVQPTDPSFIDKVKTFYHSCVNRDTETRGYQPLRDMIISEFGEWPLTPGQLNESAFDLVDLVIKANRHKAEAILLFSVIINVFDQTSYVMRVHQPMNFGMGQRSAYLIKRNSLKMAVYEDKIFEIAKVFGIDNETAVRQAISDIVDLEIKVALTTVAVPFVRYIKNDVNNWHTRFSNEIFDLLRFFKTVVSTPDFETNNVTATDVIVTSPGIYVRNLLPALQNTSKTTIVNYVVWRVIDSYLDTFPKSDNSVMSSSQWSVCVENIAYTSDLMYAGNQMFLRASFRNDDKIQVAHMILTLKAAITEMMDEIEWLDEPTRQQSKAKAAAVDANKIGYSEKIYNDSALEMYYSNVTFTRGRYFENTVALRKDTWEKMVRKLRVPIDVNDSWVFLPIEVNAFYDPPTNSMEFPASVFHPPYYGRGEPKSLQYGGLGAVIGHEITHGFDQSRVAGWNASALASFNNQSRCFIDQYNRYAEKEINESASGVNTLDENIADNGGVRQAFRAYRNWVATQKIEEPSLPGLNYTHNQLYFISYARLYCELWRKESEIVEIKDAVWSIGRYRVKGPPQNMKEFAEAFNCPTNSYMNPSNKCVLW